MGMGPCPDKGRNQTGDRILTNYLEDKKKTKGMKPLNGRLSAMITENIETATST